MEAIQFIEQRLDRPFLTVRTQLRLGMLFQVVRGMASAGEYQSLRAVLAKGEKYPTFYWMALTKPSPEYIDLFFGVLTNKKDVLAYGFNPDGEKIEPYVLQEFVVADLQEATGKDFGRDDKKWREWWDVEGQHLEYDRDSGKYRGKVE